MYSAKGFSLRIDSLVRKIARNHSKDSHKRRMVSEKIKMGQVPKGYLPIYVGKEGKRYEVPVKYLSLSSFQELIISQSQDYDELDTKIHGPIKLVCTAEIFDQTLKLAGSF